VREVAEEIARLRGGWAASEGDRSMIKGLVMGAGAAVRFQIAGERFVDTGPPPVVDLTDADRVSARIAS